MGTDGQSQEGELLGSSSDHSLLTGWRRRDNSLRISETINPRLSEALELQAILELQGKIISLQKCRSVPLGLRCHFGVFTECHPVSQEIVHLKLP